MSYSTNKATYFTAVRTLQDGVTWYNINACDFTVIVLDFYNLGGGSIMVGGMVGYVTHRPYCDAGL